MLFTLTDHNVSLHLYKVNGCFLLPEVNCFITHACLIIKANPQVHVLEKRAWKLLCLYCCVCTCRACTAVPELLCLNCCACTAMSALLSLYCCVCTAVPVLLCLHCRACTAVPELLCRNCCACTAVSALLCLY